MKNLTRIANHCIPSSPGLSLGSSFDLTTWPDSICDGGNVEEKQKKGKPVAFAYKKIETLTDVSDILRIHLVYLLKVSQKLIFDDVAAACLESLGDKKSLTIVFRATLIEFEKCASVKPVNTQHDHWVNSLEVGNELITILTFKSDYDVTDISEGFDEDVADQEGHLNIERLKKFADTWDKKLSQTRYSDVTSTIHYCTYQNVHFPTTLAGIVEALKDFSSYCKDDFPHQQGNIEKKIMFCKKFTRGDEIRKPIAPFTIQLWTLYYIKAVVAPLTEAGQQPQHGPSTILQHQGDAFNRLFQALYDIEEAHNKIKKCLHTDCVDSKRLMHEGEKIKKEVLKSKDKFFSFIRNMGIGAILLKKDMDNVTELNILNKVEVFLNNTTIVPEGRVLDLQLMMIGKTGHGKSSTCNSIFNTDIFEVSSASISCTSDVQTHCGKVDNRTITVVDTPGVMDTRMQKGQDANDIAVTAITNAIVDCHRGIDALLLVFNFYSKMTKEEVAGVEYLRNLFGRDVIKSRVVCVLTHGEEFERNRLQKNGSTFLQKCQNEKSFLRDLYKECDYRCVLFQNCTEDETVRKLQLVKLIDMIDQVAVPGKRYSSEIFEIARQAREEEILKIRDENIVNALEPVMVRLKNMQTLLLTAPKSVNENDIVSLQVELSNHKKEIQKIHKADDYLPKINTGIQFCEREIKKLREIDIQLVKQNCDRKMKELESQAAEYKRKMEKEEEKKRQRDAEERRRADEEKEKAAKKQKEAEEAERIRKAAAEATKPVVKKNGCFPGTSFVLLKDGQTKMLNDLDISDEVQVRVEKGMLQYDQVFMFGHRDLDTVNEFILFKTRTNVVCVTADHLVYCWKDGVEMCIPACNVTVGDSLIIADGQDFFLQTVNEITYERKQGLLAPFTLCGNIVVDGCLMSCYVDVLDHEMSHRLLWPVRQLYRISPEGLAWLNGDKQRRAMPQWVQMALKWL